MAKSLISTNLEDSQDFFVDATDGSSDNENNEQQQDSDENGQEILSDARSDSFFRGDSSKSDINGDLSDNSQNLDHLEVRNSDNEDKESESEAEDQQEINSEPEELEREEQEESDIEVVEENSVPRTERKPKRENKKPEKADDSEDDLEIVLVAETNPTDHWLRSSSTKGHENSKPKSEGNSHKRTKEQPPAEGKKRKVEEPSYEPEKDDFEEIANLSNTELDLEPDTEVNTPHVVEVLSDSDEEPENLQPRKTESNGPRSEIRLLANKTHDLSQRIESKDLNTDTIVLEELIGLPDLTETVQFNFSVDLELFVNFLHPRFIKERRPITFITGGLLLAPIPKDHALRTKFNIKEFVAPLPNRFATHHSKFMVNSFADGTVEIVISTFNITLIDFGGLTQACWRSGRLHLGKTKGKSGKRFKKDFTRYLRQYKNDKAEELAEKLLAYNFSHIDVELVVSVPGRFKHTDIPKGEVYGYGKLRQVLERNDLLLEEEESSRHNILAQVTSLAYPYKTQKGKTASVFTHLLCPLFFKGWEGSLEPGAHSAENHREEHNYSPQIIFPTVGEIAKSNYGYASGLAIHFKYTETSIHKAQYEENIKPFLHRWGNSEDVTGRELLTPHVKYYACDNGDDWKSLKWALIGSHNLSKQAWGYPISHRPGEYEVGSYEMSILIPRKEKPLVPTYKRDTLEDSHVQPVRFPFMVPPTKYHKHDQPWSATLNCGTRKDIWGNVHQGGFSL